MDHGGSQRPGSQTVLIEATKARAVAVLCPEGHVPHSRQRVVPKGNPLYSGTAVDAPYKQRCFLRDLPSGETSWTAQIQAISLCLSAAQPPSPGSCGCPDRAHA